MKPQRPEQTTAVFFPFDQFGSAGTSAGAHLLADAFAEMLDDNRREKVPTRAAVYRDHVRSRELTFETPADFQDWRERGRQAVRQVWKKGELLFWTAGNHLGLLPVYDELAAVEGKTLVVQFDAHLDVYNLTDCTAELSHGNFLLHCAGPLPAILNVGSRELLLRPEHVRKFYREVFPAADLAVDPGPALEKVRKACRQADRIFIDIDCDVFDPAFFPAVVNPLPLGLSPHLLLRFLEAAWSDKVIGVGLSEFDPARDRADQSLGTLIWLLEYLLMKRYRAEPI